MEARIASSATALGFGRLLLPAGCGGRVYTAAIE
jgi:hypothetical protein